MKRKAFMTMALAMALTAGSLSGLTVPMTVHAEEADGGVEAHDENNDVGDILDGIFGGNKPDYNPDGNYDDADRNNGKDDSINDDNMGFVGDVSGGSSGGGSSQPSEPSAPPSNPSGGNSGSGNNDVGNILDDMFGGNKPDYNPDGNYDDADRNNGKDDSINDDNMGFVGGIVGGGSGTATTPTAPGVPTLGQPYAPILAQPGVPATVQPGADGSLTVMNPIAVAPTAVATPIADPEIQALFPNAMFVMTANGVTLHAFDVAKQTYHVWEAGNIVTAFGLVDGKNNVLAMSAPQLLPAADGRVFINVTVDQKAKGLAVNATAEQKAAFVTSYGIHGVMVNGVLIEEFTAPAAVVLPAAAK